MVSDFGAFVSVTLPILGAVATLTWWLSAQFQKVKDEATRAMHAHELVDEKRHEDNLERFSKLSSAVAGLSKPNGPYTYQGFKGS
jgi:hypothetical protein